MVHNVVGLPLRPIRSPVRVFGREWWIVGRKIRHFAHRVDRHDKAASFLGDVLHRRCPRRQVICVGRNVNPATRRCSAQVQAPTGILTARRVRPLTRCLVGTMPYAPLAYNSPSCFCQFLSHRTCSAAEPGEPTRSSFRPFQRLFVTLVGHPRPRGPRPAAPQLLGSACSCQIRRAAKGVWSNTTLRCLYTIWPSRSSSNAVQ